MLPTPPLFYPALQPLLNKLVLFGGHDSLGNYQKGTWYFNIAQQQWMQGPALPSSGRKGGMAAGFQEKFFYTCGLGTGNQRLNETWMLDLPLGTEENVKSDLSVFPNPFSFETIINTDKHLSNATLTVYNLQGQVKRHKMAVAIAPTLR